MFSASRRRWVGLWITLVGKEILWTMKVCCCSTRDTVWCQYSIQDHCFAFSIPRSSMDIVCQGVGGARQIITVKQSFLSGTPVIKHEQQHFKGTCEPRYTHTHIVLGQEVRRANIADRDPIHHACGERSWRDLREVHDGVCHLGDFNGAQVNFPQKNGRDDYSSTPVGFCSATVR